jgi:dihydrofolate reductase
MKQIITIVVAMNQDNVIGIDNQLPWHIPEDLKYFKQATLGKPIVMGRKTFESIGRVLPGRKNIVITRSEDFMRDGVTVYHSLEAALQDNQEYPEICIIGGGEIFQQALPITTNLYLTIVDWKVINPTVYFPKINFDEWNLNTTEEIISSTGIKCKFNLYYRKINN